MHVSPSQRFRRCASNLRLCSDTIYVWKNNPSPVFDTQVSSTSKRRAFRVFMRCLEGGAMPPAVTRCPLLEYHRGLALRNLIAPNLDV